MARARRFPMARGSSPPIPRLVLRAPRGFAPAQHGRAWTRSDRLEGEELAPGGAHSHCKVEARERLAACDVAQLERETLERRQAGGFEMQMRNLKAPAAWLT